MTKLLEWLDGKKTYITVAATFIIGGLEALGYGIPSWVYALLAALGVGFLRRGVGKSA